MRPVEVLFSVYITTNSTRSILYTGMTNNLEQRIIEHYADRGTSRSFAGKYWAYFLVFYECYSDPLQAILREKEIKAWRREKKEELITEFNPDWEFLNEELLGEWPPLETFHRRSPWS